MRVEASQMGYDRERERINMQISRLCEDKIHGDESLHTRKEVLI